MTMVTTTLLITTIAIYGELIIFTSKVTFHEQGGGDVFPKIWVMWCVSPLCIRSWGEHWSDHRAWVLCALLLCGLWSQAWIVCWSSHLEMWSQSLSLPFSDHRLTCVCLLIWRCDQRAWVFHLVITGLNVFVMLVGSCEHSCDHRAWVLCVWSSVWELEGLSSDHKAAVYTLICTMPCVFIFSYLSCAVWAVCRSCTVSWWGERSGNRSALAGLLILATGWSIRI